MDIGVTEIVIVGLTMVAGFAVTRLYPKFNMLARNYLPENEARAMIERRLADSDAEVTAVMLVREALEQRPDIEAARAKAQPFWEERQRQMEAGKARWKPNLLEDETLQRVCEEFDRESSGLFFEALGVHNGYTRDSFLSTCGRRLARLSELRGMITRSLENDLVVVTG
jgi:hypothetical protein